MMVVSAIVGQYGHRFYEKGWAGLPRVVVIGAARWCELDPAGRKGPPDHSLQSAIVKATQRRLTEWEQRLLRWSLSGRMAASAARERLIAGSHAKRAWRYGNDMSGLTPRMAALCVDADPEVAARMVEMLGVMRRGDPALEALWLRLKLESRDDGLRSLAARNLTPLVAAGRHGSVPALVAAVQEGGHSTRGAALLALAQTGDAAMAERMGRAASGALSEPFRLMLLGAIGKMGEQGTPAAPWVLRFLVSGNEGWA